MDFIYAQNKLGLPRFAMFDKQTDEFIGLAGFCFYDPKHEDFENGKVEISYQFLKKAWGKGLASEIVQAFKEFAFKYFRTSSS